MSRSSRRIELQRIFEQIVPNVYFQPPTGKRLVYPCIIYSLSGIDTKYADNTKYKKTNKYSVTLIINDPDNELVDELLKLRMCSFERSFVIDNLYHYNYNIYY